MRIVTILVLASLIPGFSFFAQTNGSSNPYPKSAEELKMELEMNELDSPLTYLSGGELHMENHRRKIRNGGLFRDAEYENDGATISGNIINTATLADYKDLKITLSFFSATETKLAEQTYTVYEFFRHGETTFISFYIESVPSAMSTFSYQISGAQPVFK